MPTPVVPITLGLAGLILLFSKKASAEAPTPITPKALTPPKRVVYSDPASSLPAQKADALAKQASTDISKTAQDVAHGLGRMFQL